MARAHLGKSSWSATTYAHTSWRSQFGFLALSALPMFVNLGIRQDGIFIVGIRDMLVHIWGYCNECTDNRTSIFGQSTTPSQHLGRVYVRAVRRGEHSWVHWDNTQSEGQLRKSVIMHELIQSIFNAQWLVCTFLRDICLTTKLRNGETAGVWLLQHDIGVAYPIKGSVPRSRRIYFLCES